MPVQVRTLDLGKCALDLPCTKFHLPDTNKSTNVFSRRSRCRIYGISILARTFTLRVGIWQVHRDVRGRLVVRSTSLDRTWSGRWCQATFNGRRMWRRVELVMRMVIVRFPCRSLGLSSFDARHRTCNAQLLY